MTALLGTPVIMAPGMADGTVLSVSQPWPQILIGTRKLPEHREEARRIVREGLADVLAWLGEPVRLPTGEEVWASIKAAAAPEPGPAKVESGLPTPPRDSSAWTDALDRLMAEALTFPSHVWDATRYDEATADPIGDIKAVMAAFKRATTL